MGKRMNALAIAMGFLIFLSTSGQGVEPQKIGCFTDKNTYRQGERVSTNIVNHSGDDILIADRKYIDGGVATIQIKGENETWRAIELFAAANVVTFKTLKNGESHTYIWNTKGYNRADTVANPGAYRIVFTDGIISNHFEITGSRGSQ